MVNTDIPARGEFTGEFPLSSNLYAGLLRRDRAGADDGFFDLGGDSLQARQLVARLRADLAADIDVTAVFQARQPAVFLRDRQGLDDLDLDEVGTDGGTE